MIDNVKKIPIRIEKINSSIFQLMNIHSTVLAKISKNFSFLPAGYKFHPKYRLMGESGVTIRMIRTDGTFPAGLFSEVVQFITEELEKEVVMSNEVIEHFLPLTELLKEEISDDVFSNFTFDGVPVILRDYQYEALLSAFENRNCLLNLSTGAGKCLGPKTKLKIRVPKEIANKYNLEIK